MVSFEKVKLGITINSILGLSLGLFVACEAPSEPVYGFEIPLNQEPFEQPAYNVATVEGVALGRKLFYDPMLSGNNQISCATCHQQSRAFSDGLSLRAETPSGNPLERHVPALINLGWTSKLFWDGGVPNLEFLATAPIKHPDEMDQDLIELNRELNDHHEYPELFRSVFETDRIESSHVSYALAQFLRSLTSFDSPYDRSQHSNEALSPSEAKGYVLFKQHCGSCHTEGLFTDNGFHNNGLDSIFVDDTLFGLVKGRFRITRDSADMGKFKTPTLRNVGLTAPYMHDGRFSTLTEVLNHYRYDIKKSSYTDDFLMRNYTKFQEISDEEIAYLLAFLKTITDSTFINNPTYSNPG